MVDELNPNHPVTRELHDQWHKLLAFVLHRLSVPSLDITEDDIRSFQEFYGEGGAIVCDTRRPNVLQLRLVGEDEARELARREGGLAN